MTIIKYLIYILFIKVDYIVIVWLKVIMGIACNGNTFGSDPKVIGSNPISPEAI